MSGRSPVAKLVFVHDFSERDAIEAQDRGYLSHVLAEIDGVRLYPVVFYDPVRLQQDLEEMSGHGRAFVCEPGLIVLPDVTLEAMQAAVQRLAQEGFFDYMVPLSRERLREADPYRWPP
jgi:hypothetical protein